MDTPGADQGLQSAVDTLFIVGGNRLLHGLQFTADKLLQNRDIAVPGLNAAMDHACRNLPFLGARLTDGEFKFLIAVKPELLTELDDTGLTPTGCDRERGRGKLQYLFWMIDDELADLSVCNSQFVQFGVDLLQDRHARLFPIPAPEGSIFGCLAS